MFTCSPTGMTKASACPVQSSCCKYPAELAAPARDPERLALDPAPMGPPRPGPHQSGAPAGRRGAWRSVLSARPSGASNDAVLRPFRAAYSLPPTGGGDGIFLRSGSARRPWTRVASVRIERASRPQRTRGLRRDWSGGVGRDCRQRGCLAEDDGGVVCVGEGREMGVRRRQRYRRASSR